MRQLGQVLLDQGLITNAQLDEAIEEQRERGRSLGRILVDRGFISERDLVTALAAQVGMEFVDLAEIEVDPRAVTMLAPSLSKRHALLPIRFEDGRLVVAMSDPSNVVAMDDVRTVTKMDIKVVIATRESVLAAVDRYASMADDIEAMADDLAGDDGAEDLAALTAVTEDAPIVKFVNLLISQAVADGASDIHIEPGEKELRVRYRIDGVLHEVMKSPKSIQSGVISRLKIMAEVDIAERRVPQDGRIGLNVHGKAIDLRFSTLPTVHGEKVVMRILDKTSVMMTLDDLGFLDHNERRYESAYRKPYGMILVTGPTG
ncbi:MAG: ATPase, T2SS/T4P/T4SS family, partial [Nitriliruptor sp.]|uniref:GspE/PulE family protein n=1 Tax=Nitriliruptor sp. TaxID=2448056 RepID=UPI0034A0277F